MTSYMLTCKHSLIETNDEFKFMYGKEGRLMFLCEECNTITIIDVTKIELPK